MYVWLSCKQNASFSNGVALQVKIDCRMTAQQSRAEQSSGGDSGRDVACGLDNLRAVMLAQKRTIKAVSWNMGCDNNNNNNKKFEGKLSKYKRKKKSRMFCFQISDFRPALLLCCSAHTCPASVLWPLSLARCSLAARLLCALMMHSVQSRKSHAITFARIIMPIMQQQKQQEHNKFSQTL